MTRLLVVVFLFAVFPVNTLAQHQHSASSLASSNVSESDAEMIDGSEHPELVPDAVAYRLYLVVVSEAPNPTDEQRNRQNAHLSKVGLGKSDLQSVVTVLTAFKVQYGQLIANYNAAAEVGATVDIKAFLSQRDGLVQATRDRLKALLTPEAMARLDRVVQNEKKQMRVSATEAQ